MGKSGASTLLLPEELLVPFLALSFTIAGFMLMLQKPKAAAWIVGLGLLAAFAGPFLHALLYDLTGHAGSVGQQFLALFEYLMATLTLTQLFVLAVVVLFLALVALFGWSRTLDLVRQVLGNLITDVIRWLWKYMVLGPAAGLGRLIRTLLGKE